MSASERILIYVLRRDLRLADNPILNEVSKLAQQSQRPFTHLLPVYIFSADQIEVSGFISGSDKKSPYPEARSQVGGFWRCGTHRAKFIAESVWDLKHDLQNVNSGLTIRVGTLKDAIRSLLKGFANSQGDGAATAVWMTAEEGVEEKREERDVKRLCGEFGADFKLWGDEKYFIDDRDLPFKDIRELSDVFTSFRKTVEPLRDAPRKAIPEPSQLLPLPSHVPPQFEPFFIPDTLDGVVEALVKPLGASMQLPNPPSWPADTKSAHPFKGGSAEGHKRVKHLVASGAMTDYKDTRNGLVGVDFSTKLSAWLALGCITARQVHWYLISFEEGTNDLGKGTHGYGKGENKGTGMVRFELLWRDYMRLCTRKFGPRLFRPDGFRGEQQSSQNTPRWKWVSGLLSQPGKNSDAQTHLAAQRFLNGTTGTGLIDASQREVLLTGYTSNRARQNVASFLAKHLGIDWRIGAEWYECCLVDYDVSSNWGNWQYVAGVGNDPRGEHRVFNPVKQALDYDPQAAYIVAWVPELRPLTADGAPAPDDLMAAFQPWRLEQVRRNDLGLAGVDWVERPLKKIDFSLNRRGGGGGGGGGGGRGRGRGRGGDGHRRRGGDASRRRGGADKAGSMSG